MPVNRIHNRSRELFAYMYIMVTAVFILGAVVLLSLFSIQDVELETRDRVTYFHLKSSAIAQELRQEVRELEHIFFPHQHIGNDEKVVRMHASLDQRVLLTSIEANVRKLDALQTVYGGDEFAATLQRLSMRAEELNSIFAQQPSVAEAERFTRSLEHSVLQLARLHMVAAEKTLFFRDGGDVRARPFFVALLAFAATTALIVVFTMRLVRSSVAREESVRAALELNREQLHHMQKLDALGQLVGGVAHDFNNLLTAIIGQTNQLLKSTETDKARHGLTQIHQASSQAANLTRQLLAFSRMQPVETRVFYVNELLRDIDSMLKRMIGEDIILEMKLGGDLPPVEMDVTQLRQVVLNLASNARDAMPRGGRVTISTSGRRVESAEIADLEPGDYVQIVMSDTGVGMTAETSKRVFEPFFTTKPMDRGTGLGLSTVHGIVAGAGGNISVSSQVGNGSSFTVLLRCSSKPAVPLIDEPAAQPTAEGTETVLIVEDEELIRTMLREGLKQFGYEVLVAADAREGLEYCAGSHGDIDVLVSDVIMPQTNGAEFLDEAKRLQPTATCILMSGYTDNVLEDSGLELGRIPLLQKPFEIEKLAQLVRTQLDERAARSGR